jgi:CHAD domain-containing protein
MAQHTRDERELKFEAGIGVPLPDLRPLVDRTVRKPQQRLKTAYYDSNDGRLWARGLTLRHRITGDAGDGGTWTLKAPVGSDRWLDRSEVSWPGHRDTVPPEVHRVLRGVLRREPLRQLVELDTTRQRLLLRDDHGTVVAELDDDLVTVSGGERNGLQFRQVELEVRGDETWSGESVVAELAGAGLTVESTPKLARALPLPTEGPDDSRVRLNSRSTLVDLVGSCLVDGFQRLVDHDWRLRLSLPHPDPHDVHQARVATRRLRSDLKTLASMLDPVWVQHVRSDLKWLGSALGDVRDADVLNTKLTGIPHELQETLLGQRLARCLSLASALDSERYLQLLERLHAASERPPVGGGDGADVAARSARDALPELVGARWRALRRQVRKAGHHPSPERLHRVRIKSKQLRYAAESAVPVVGRPARRLAKAAEKLQTTLGDHHDLVAAERWLQNQVCSDHGPWSSPATAYEAGAISAAVRQRREQFEIEWRRDWRALKKPKRRRWLEEASDRH